MDIKDTLTLSDIQKEVDDWIKEFGEAKYKGSFIKYFMMRLNMKVFGHSE